MCSILKSHCCVQLYLKESILKQLRTSRPISGDRYLVLRDRIADNGFVQTIVDHLLCTNASLVGMQTSGGDDNNDLIELVSAQRLSADADAVAFVEYMRHSNTLLAMAQTLAMQKRLYAMQNPRYCAVGKAEIAAVRQACYRAWDVVRFEDGMGGDVVSNFGNGNDDGDVALMEPEAFVHRLAPGLKLFCGVNANMAIFCVAVEQFRYVIEIYYILQDKTLLMLQQYFHCIFQ